MMASKIAPYFHSKPRGGYRLDGTLFIPVKTLNAKPKPSLIPARIWEKFCKIDPDLPESLLRFMNAYGSPFHSATSPIEPFSAETAVEWSRLAEYWTEAPIDSPPFSPGKGLEKWHQILSTFKSTASWIEKNKFLLREQIKGMQISNPDLEKVNEEILRKYANQINQKIAELEKVLGRNSFQFASPPRDVIGVKNLKLVPQIHFDNLLSYIFYTLKMHAVSSERVCTGPDCKNPLDFSASSKRTYCSDACRVRGYDRSREGKEKRADRRKENKKLSAK